MRRLRLRLRLCQGDIARTRIRFRILFRMRFRFRMEASSQPRGEEGHGVLGASAEDDSPLMQEENLVEQGIDMGPRGHGARASDTDPYTDPYVDPYMPRLMD